MKERFSLDLAVDLRPLHLVFCFSGKAGLHHKVSIAQQQANMTQRRVWTYGAHEEIFSNGLKGLVDVNDSRGVFYDSESYEIFPKLISPHENEM